MSVMPNQPVPSPDPGQTDGLGYSRTNWSMIFEAVGDTSNGCSNAMERIVQRYWPAVFAFIRSSGKSVDEAGDLTQGFLCDVLLGRNLLQSASPDRGRFRSLLLKSVSNYVREQHRNSNRKKRSPGGVSPLSLHESETSWAAISRDQSPEEAFHSQWAASLVRQVLEEVRIECEQAGQEAHWDIFVRRIVRPKLFGEKPVSYEELVKHWSLRNPAQAANMMVTVKRRVARALLNEAADTVTDSMVTRMELEELRSLMEPGR